MTDKSRAHYLVTKAIKEGTLVRQPCEVCVTTEGIHGHHDDYSKPLEVRWLCNFHHGKHHAAENRPEIYVCPVCGEEEDSDLSDYCPPLCLWCRTAYELMPHLIERGWMNAVGNTTPEFGVVVKKFSHLRTIDWSNQRDRPVNPIAWPE
jgi:hypothetical protein